jgi:D-lactate dehydrogenase (cytochrome)
MREMQVVSPISSSHIRHGKLTSCGQAVGEIRKALGDENVSVDDENLKLHGFSEWSPSNIDTLPAAVVYPKSTEEVSRIMKRVLPLACLTWKSYTDNLYRICHKYKVPVIGYSGGSSLEGNFSAPHGGITCVNVLNPLPRTYSDDTDSVDFINMDAVVKLHEEDMDVVVQPAVGWVDLNKKLADRGLFFPVDPSPSAKIGGMVRVLSPVILRSLFWI